MATGRWASWGRVLAAAGGGGRDEGSWRNDVPNFFFALADRATGRSEASRRHCGISPARGVENYAADCDELHDAPEAARLEGGGAKSTVTAPLRLSPHKASTRARAPSISLGHRHVVAFLSPLLFGPSVHGTHRAHRGAAPISRSALGQSDEHSAPCRHNCDYAHLASRYGRAWLAAPR